MYKRHPAGFVGNDRVGAACVECDVARAATDRQRCEQRKRRAIQDVDFAIGERADVQFLTVRCLGDIERIPDLSRADRHFVVRRIRVVKIPNDEFAALDIGREQFRPVARHDDVLDPTTRDRKMPDDCVGRDVHHSDDARIPRGHVHQRFCRMECDARQQTPYVVCRDVARDLQRFGIDDVDAVIVGQCVERAAVV